MNNYNKFQKIINGSIRYEMAVGGELTITSYYTGEEITINLSRLDEDTLEELIVESEEEQYE